jgi:2-oxoglutarate ferredoxin oxidoreductase subunit beta
LDIISPCVTFYNLDNSLHSYAGGRDHEAPIHQLSFIQAKDEITLEDFEDGTVREVDLHDGSVILLKKLEKDYDPRDKAQAYQILEEGHKNGWLVTGLIYIDPEEPTMHDHFNLVDCPLNRLTNDEIRPARNTLERINKMML